MEHNRTLFVLWMGFFPLIWTIISYISTIEESKNGQSPKDDDSSWWYIVIYVVVAVILY
jgi:hypothetical protein